jgi:diaminopimelate epimerase
MTCILPFTKMHGAGNDFVMLDGRDLTRLELQLERSQVALLCHRQKGIGADGLIIIGPDSDTDFRMIYFNSDGGEAEMCGNGARCAFAHAQSLGLVGDEGVFVTASGVLNGQTSDSTVTVSLTAPRDIAHDVQPKLQHPFGPLHHANTGVPHLVAIVDQLESVDIVKWGSALRHDQEFAPVGVNVNWVQRRDDGVWLIRTYERGVEAETLACGTGASACALILVQLGLADSPVPLLTRGGDQLTIRVAETDGSPSLELTGPAVTAFRGEVTI